MKITIEEKFNRYRLDKFLVEHFQESEGFSRSKLQKMIKDELISVNGNVKAANYRIKTDEVVELKKEVEDAKKPIVKKSIHVDWDEVIIEDCDEYLLINKPAGLIVHDYEHSTEETLADAIVKKYPAISKIGEDPARPGIVHRLDREVSGLMVIPKTQDSFDNLKKQFKDRTIKKYYKSLVYGNVIKDLDIIKFPITRSKSRYKMAALPQTNKGEENEDGKRAISEFTVLERFINYTYIKVAIKTGRTHQIRVHISAYGHPIVGDNVYTTNKLREKNKKFDLGRIFLVAYYLSFKNLAGEVKEYEIDIPQSLKNFLKTAK